VPRRAQRNGDTYLKSPYYKPLVTGDDDRMPGMYRVGPLARLNMCERMGTPLADEALEEFRERRAGDATSSFHYHHARLIEVLACVEQIEELLLDRRSPTPGCGPRGGQPGGASGLRRRRAARCSTTTPSTSTGWSPT
jgi:coenzyme F420-reducing hydrogenase alpha subunit